jgi:PilZ domain
MAANPLVLNIPAPPVHGGDRRRFRRYPLDTDLTYRIRCVGPDLRIFSGRTLNMSRNGLLFTTQGSPSVSEIGSRLELQVSWPADGQMLENRLACLHGTVVRQYAGSVAIAIARFTFRDRMTSKRKSEDHRKFSTSPIPLPARST